MLYDVILDSVYSMCSHVSFVILNMKFSCFVGLEALTPAWTPAQFFLTQRTGLHKHLGVAAKTRLGVVVHGASARGEAFCCDATSASPIRRDGSPVAGAPGQDGAVLGAARRRKLAHYPELACAGPHRLRALAAKVGRRWSNDSQQLVRSLVRLPASRVQSCAARLRRVEGAGLRGWMPASGLQRCPRGVDYAAGSRH